MTNLPYIVGAYAIALGVCGWFSVSAALRLGRARRRLAALDPRGRGDTR